MATIDDDDPYISDIFASAIFLSFSIFPTLQEIVLIDQGVESIVVYRVAQKK